MSVSPSRRPATLLIEEHSLIEISDLLGADRLELVGSTVTFLNWLPGGDQMRWTAELGDHLLWTGSWWRVTPELPRATTPAFVA